MSNQPTQQEKAARKRWRGHKQGILKSFRLTENSVSKIEHWAEGMAATQTAALESLIESAPASPPAE